MVETLVSKYDYKLKEVAKEFGKSSSQLSGYRKKWNNLTEKIQRAYQNGEISAKDAGKLADVDTQIQEELTQELKDVNELEQVVNTPEEKEQVKELKKNVVEKATKKAKKTTKGNSDNFATMHYDVLENLEKVYNSKNSVRVREAALRAYTALEILGELKTGREVGEVSSKLINFYKELLSTPAEIETNEVELPA